MRRLKYTFKTDTLFKMLFVKHPELLKKLVAELLDMKVEDIEEFQIMNPEILPDILEGKRCRFDIHMKVCGQMVDLEVQVRDEKNLPERSLYYWSREYARALGKGEDYSLLPRTIVINIINFKLFDCKEYQSEYRPLEVTRHTLLTDKMSLKFFELRKLPRAVDANNKLLLWLQLFKADTEEELMKLEKTQVPEIIQAVEAYRNIVKSEEFKEYELMLDMMDHDDAQRMKNAEERGERRGEKRGVKRGKELADKKWEKMMADKDNELANLKAINAELRAQLGESFE